MLVSRHQDHELVPAIAATTSDAAAIRFRMVPHALQDQVAFQMPVKIVDKFEIDRGPSAPAQMPARARRALPLGRQRFHEERCVFTP